MNPKIAIAIIMAMLVAMPLTHVLVGYKAYKHGRVTMGDEIVKAVGKYTFVLNGKIATLKPEIVRNFLACSTGCHGMPM